MGGEVDMSVTVGQEAVQTSISDAEFVTITAEEKHVELFIVEKNKTRAGGSFFPYLNITILDLSKYGIFKTVGRNKYKHNCLYLALQAGGLSDVELQELILSLRNRHIHKCDLEMFVIH